MVSLLEIQRLGQDLARCTLLEQRIVSDQMTKLQAA